MAQSIALSSLIYTYFFDNLKIYSSSSFTYLFFCLFLLLLCTCFLSSNVSLAIHLLSKFAIYLWEVYANTFLSVSHSVCLSVCLLFLLLGERSHTRNSTETGLIEDPSFLISFSVDFMAIGSYLTSFVFISS
jgi:hypothetical protein